MTLTFDHDFGGGRILVAVSGGPDSIALLLALRESHHDIVAAHYDHALREGSDVPARQVAALCQDLGIQLISERRHEPVPKGSLQAAARQLRYAFLDRAREQARAEVIATAHTADDLVEGVVLHLLRGCGLAGFRGMPARRGHYVRPFLRVWRTQVREFLAERGVTAYEDPSNRDPRFARVRVRTQILPALERDRPGITRRFHAAAIAAARLQEEAESAPTTVENLRRLYAQAGGRQPGLSRRHLEAMAKLAEGRRGGRGVDLPGALRFRIVGGRMEVVPSQPAHTRPVLEVTSCTGCGDSRAAHLREGLNVSLGFRRPGLRMRPLGGRGTRKLQDIFVDARVPREDRDAWPLVFADGKLAWVPGVAVDAELAAPAGEPGLHIAITPIPVRSAENVVRLKAPIPRGD
ncbi:MAG TPA: tRNA lysidine(34) synthetase TilS [Candidatus Dormibacteraeota bacterium]|nr:tRNA lysidine(34) synthetase TilS [Candidatus Dormibacteraeota bacterium]